VGVERGVSVYDILLYYINVYYVHSIDGEGGPTGTQRPAERGAVAFFDKQLTRVSGHPVGRLPVAI